MIKILYKKLHKDAVAPERKHLGDAGWDVTAVTSKSLWNNEFKNCIKEYGIGLAFAIPRGMWMLLASRSSVYKTRLVMAGGIGVIDSGYRGEVVAKFYMEVDDEELQYKVGDRVAQLIPMPCGTDDVEFVEVDELPDSWDGRGDGGFGSTNEK